MRRLAAVFVLALIGLAARAAEPPFGERAAFETFLDGVMAKEMASSRVPGAVVVVVRNGEVFFSKGYGYANLETKAPVMPDRTIFRIGSVTKVFTATAVMQLAEREQLSLTEDVNRYLRTAKVPATYRQPVTAASLLTHTAGLDEISPGRRTANPAAQIPLAQFLAPRLVRRKPPGTTISYSTYNMALAGHLVESITGKHLREFFAENVFTPLQMTRTSLGAVPPAQQRDLAVGYDERHRPLPFEYFHTYPASDINSTGADMGRFMLAQLGHGPRILSERATRQMQQRQFANHPKLIGMTYGWFENRRNGVAAIEHGGVMDGYAALLWLAPKENVGIFVAANIENSGFPVAVRNAIIDRSFTAPEEPVPPAVRAPLTRFAGSYRNDIWCHSCPAGARGFLPSAVKITVNDDGTLSLWGGRWVQIEPLLFRLTGGRLDNGEVVIAFRDDAAGRITHFFNGAWSHERIDDPRSRAVRIPRRTLQRYAGRYQLAPERFVTITVEGDRLFGEMTGQPRVELVATARNTFVAVDADAQVTFVDGALVLRLGGRELRAARVKESDP